MRSKTEGKLVQINKINKLRGDERLSHRLKSALFGLRAPTLAPSPMSSSSIYISLVLIYLRFGISRLLRFACSRALRSITSSSREAAFRACCALLYW
jgi:hypothetical protein